MRRIQNIPQDPDLEVSRAEADAIEGRKNAAQNDVLRLAENKKEVEKSRADMIERLDKEIEDKIRLSNETTEKHNQLIATHEAEVIASLARRDKAAQDADIAQKQLDGIRSAYADVETKHVEKTAIVGVLIKRETDLKQSIAVLEGQKADTDQRVAAALTAKNEHEKARDAVKGEHAIELADYQKTHARNLEVKADSERLEKENREANDTLGTKKSLVNAADIDLKQIQEKAAETEAASIKRDEESNRRLTAASQLEQLVDTKLGKLKEVEAQFTAEHLARMGYKKVDPSFVKSPQ